MRTTKEIAQDFFRPLSWIRLVLGVAIVLGVWLYFSKPTQDVKVGKGGVANIYNQNRRSLIPFVEVYAGKEKNYNDLNYGIRGGVRFEF